MSKVGEEVLEEFYARLEKASDIDKETVKELRKLLDSGRKVKPDELVAVFEREKEQGVP